MQANTCMSSSTSAYAPRDGALLFSEMDDDNQRPEIQAWFSRISDMEPWKKTSP